MKELETMKQLEPHPYVIKLLGCITESGMLWLWRFSFVISIFLAINSVRLFSRDKLCSGFWDSSFGAEPLYWNISECKKSVSIVGNSVLTTGLKT